MIWNAVADAKLLSALILVYDVRMTGEKMNEVAKIMGPECTASALSHRIGKIRALAKAGAGEGEGQVDNEKPKKATKTAKSGAAPKKNGKGGKKATAARTPSPDADGEGYPTPPDTKRAKRAGSKRNYAELTGETGSDDGAGVGDDGLDKKVNIAVGEDIGEGLRQGPDDDMFT